MVNGTDLFPLSLYRTRRRTAAGATVPSDHSGLHAYETVGFVGELIKNASVLNIVDSDFVYPTNRLLSIMESRAFMD